MFLAFNAGNTHVVCAAFQGEDLIHAWKVRSDAARTVDEYRVFLRQFLGEVSLDPGEIEGALIASVIPRLTVTLQQAVEDLGGLTPLVLDESMDLGLENRYEPPSAVGPDRLANAVAGVERYGCPLILVDFGTATTFDVISPEGHYVGGAILPGLEMSADSLFQKTSRLPRVALSPPREVIGRNTQDSLVSGLMWGVACAVDGMAERIRMELGVPECRLVATGGDAPAIAKLCKSITDVQPDLTLHGIRILWERNRSWKS